MTDKGGPDFNEWNPAAILRAWAKAYRDHPEHRFPSDPHAEFFPVDLEAAADVIDRTSAVSAAADVLERIAKENCADPAIDNLTVPLAIKLSEALHAKDAAEARLEEMQKVCDSYAAENQRFHDRFTAAEARLAELSAVTATWQPIETAPKDGTRIIVDWGGTVVTAYYLDNSKATHFPWEGWKVPSMEKWPKGKPTHWQPMPIPVSVGRMP